MRPDTPLEIQWLAYALAVNNALDAASAQQLHENLGYTTDLGEFAEAILAQLCENMTDEEAEAMVDQIQQLVDYAFEQAATGAAPDWDAITQTGEDAEEEFSEESEEQYEEVPAEEIQPEIEEEFEKEKAPAATGAAVSTAAGITAETPLYFEVPDYDLSDINGYEDLPSLSDTPYLTEEQAAERMIYLLSCLRRLGCSDLHISAGAPPFVRRQRQIERLDSYVLTYDDARKLTMSLLAPERRAYFQQRQDMSMALILGNDRFRLCMMEQKDGFAGSYRLVPSQLHTLEELGFLPEDAIYIRRLLDYTNGLVLVTGPIGSGKTTTLAAMTNIVNEKRQDHIISVEDPIEILQPSKNCSVSQREVGRHTVSYRTALKAALREDPDVIVIGEMHDLETIENAITASETGHLVIGTLHTSDAPNTMNRILDVFPPAQQPQIRAMTAGSLRGVVCQKLIPDGFGGIVMVYEIMINTMPVANIINEGKTFRLKSTMVTSNKQGMCTFDQCILEKYSRNLMTREAALAEMTDPVIISQLNSVWAQREAAAESANRKRK